MSFGKQLDDFGVSTYDIHGLPTVLAIQFTSDFVATAGTPAVDNVYFTVDMSGDDYAPYYDSASISVPSTGPGAGVLNINLARKAGVNPTEIGVYTINAAVDMYLKNSVGDLLFHMKTYEIKIYRKGTESSTVLGSSVGMPGLNVGGETGETDPENLPPEAVEEAANPNPVSYTTVIPQDLTLETGAAGEGGGGGGGGGEDPVEPGEDIAMTVGSEKETFRVWLDGSAVIEVYSDSELTNKVFEWPTELVDAPEDESASSNYLTVELANVPVGLYALGTIYIKFVVKMRDTAGDVVRRTIRSLQAINQTGENKADIVAAVLFASHDDEDESSALCTQTSKILKFAIAATGTAAVGTALLL